VKGMVFGRVRGWRHALRGWRLEGGGKAKDDGRGTRRS